VTKKRRKHNDRFKFKVALEAVKEQQTINEIASKNNIHPNQVSTWKKKLLVEGQTVFGQQTAKKLEEQSLREAELFEQIGRLKMELEWLKKKLPKLCGRKRLLIEPRHPTLSIRRQCELIGLNRSTYYWQPAGETPLNLKLMQLIDREYTKAPFYGYRKMTIMNPEN